MALITHHMGTGISSPCGLEPASVYRGVEATFTTDWSEVDCVTCLSRRPGPPPAPKKDEYLQVFLTHDVVIARFKEWVTAQGWELKLMPRFDSNDDTYVATHMIVPQNLDQLMAERAAQHRKDHL